MRTKGKDVKKAVKLIKVLKEVTELLRKIGGQR